MAIVLQDPQYQKIITRLKEARIRAGLTQVQVAEKMKLTQVDISRIETFQTQMDVLQLEKFAQLYGILVEELFALH